MTRSAGSRLLQGVAVLASAIACSGQSSLGLHQAIANAETSSQAREGQDLVDVAQGMVTQAALRPNPRIYLQSEDLRPWADNFDFPNATEEYGYVGQQFELHGKRARRLDYAKADVLLSAAQRDAFLRQIAGRVASAYWAAVVSEQIRPLLEEDMHAVDAIVLYSQERVDAGAMRGVDLLRVQIERDRLLLALQAARRDAALARIELFRQMGVPANPTAVLTDRLESLAPIPTQAIAEILAARADVLAARQAVVAAQADVRLQKADGTPDLDVLAGYKRNIGTNTLYASLNIPLPLFNRNQGEVQRAQANVRLAQDRLLQLELSVNAEVAAASEAYRGQRELVETVLPDMRERARRNLSIMEDAYRTGGVDLLRYLDAERTAFDVEVSALRNLGEYQQTAVRLQLSYGGQP